jgi:Histidine kinase
MMRFSALNRLSSFDVDSRRAIEWGTTWALAVAVCEALAMSPERWASVQLLMWWLIYWLVPLWALIGAMLLWLLSRGELRSGWRGMALAFLIPVPLPLLVQPPASALMMHVSERLFPALHEFATTGPQPLQDALLDIGVYNLWIYVFYGGLLTAVFVLTLRTERFRSRLHASAMARSRTEELLDAERLHTLQTQVDPNLLLDSMRELEQRYRGDAESAERLLEALVEFLRNAMHGLRESESTLDAETRLARAFAQLQRERGMAGSWRVTDEEMGNARRCKFPSLLMLRLLALGGTDGRPLMRIRGEGGKVTLQMFGLTENVSEDLRQQVCARLRVLYGEGFQLSYSPSTPSQLAIVLNMQ